MRNDIQFLRGIAVLYVVFYHSGLGFLPQGFLGVDIFFVLSGFLITKLIIEQIEHNKFSFANFYQRRVNRLLPALYVTLILTSLLSTLFLTSSQLEDFLHQIIGAVTFSANMVLPTQTGYFDAAAEGKPLLHIWSLSLEEQYYFLLPLVLTLTPKRLRVVALIAGFMASIYMCFSWSNATQQNAPFLWRFSDVSKYEWAFYLLPTRAWELLAGSVTAWLYLNKQISVTRRTKIACLSIILTLGYLQITHSHPSIEALIIAYCTAVILLGDDLWLPQNFVSRMVIKVGDWSYSIYLIHWPLFAFSYLAYVGQTPLLVSCLVIIFSIFLGQIQYKYVETPFRQKGAPLQLSSLRNFVLATVLVLTIPIIITLLPKNENFDNRVMAQKELNYGFSQECQDAIDDRLNMHIKCTNSESFDTVIWGDSYAMHLVPGLSIKNNVAQITKSMCGPFLNIAIVNSNYSEQWAKDCIHFNTLAFDFIRKNKNIRNVVLSSSIKFYLQNDILANDGRIIAGSSVLVESYKFMINELNKAGKSIVFVSPPPRDGRNIGECLEREYGPALLLLGDCTISFETYQKHQNSVTTILKELESVSAVFDVSTLLCDNGGCITSKNDTWLYRDKGHLTIEGSKLILGDLKIKDLFSMQRRAGAQQE